MFLANIDAHLKVYNSLNLLSSRLCCADFEMLLVYSALTAKLSLLYIVDHLGALIVIPPLDAKTVI